MINDNKKYGKFGKHISHTEKNRWERVVDYFTILQRVVHRWEHNMAWIVEWTFEGVLEQE